MLVCVDLLLLAPDDGITFFYQLSQARIVGRLVLLAALPHAPAVPHVGSLLHALLAAGGLGGLLFAALGVGGQMQVLDLR